MKILDILFSFGSLDDIGPGFVELLIAVYEVNYVSQEFSRTLRSSVSNGTVKH